MPRPPHRKHDGLSLGALDLRGLELAITVSQSGSIRRAALHAGLTAPALSRRIRTLEDMLGVSLFERRSTGLRPTHAGALFLSATQQLLTELEAATVRAREAGAAAAGRVVVGTYFSASHGHFRDALIRFVQQYSGVSLMMVEGHRGELLHAVRDGRADLAVLLGPGDEPGLQRTPLWQERMMVALPVDHSLVSKERVRWQDLGSETFLMARSGSGPDARAIVQAMLPTDDATEFVEHDVSREGMFNLVGAGLGITLLAESASGARYPGVAFRPVGDAAGETRVEAAAYWDPKRDNPAFRRFLAQLRAAQAVEPSGGRGG